MGWAEWRMEAKEEKRNIGAGSIPMYINIYIVSYTYTKVHGVLSRMRKTFPSLPFRL